MRDFFAAFVNRPALWLLGLGGMVSFDFAMSKLNVHMYDGFSGSGKWSDFFGSFLMPFGMTVSNAFSGGKMSTGTFSGFLIGMACLLAVLVAVALITKQKANALFVFGPMFLYLLGATMYMEMQVASVATRYGGSVSVWPAFGKCLLALVLAVAIAQAILALVRIADMGSEWPGLTDQLYRHGGGKTFLLSSMGTADGYRPDGNGNGNGERHTMYTPPRSEQPTTGVAQYCWNCGGTHFMTENGGRKCRNCRAIVDNRPAGELCPCCGAALVGEPLSPKFCVNCGKDEWARNQAVTQQEGEYA